MTDPHQLADPCVELVRRWVRAATARPTHDAAADRLAALLSDPNGLAFTVGFVDRVIRTEDPSAAASALRSLMANAPASLSRLDRIQLRAGALASMAAPGLVVTVARARLRQLLGHLIVDARGKQLAKAIAKLSGAGHRLNINLLGEEVMGELEARKRLTAISELLAREDVDYVSLKVSSVVPHPSHWGFDATVDEVVHRLRPIYHQAASGRKFINLDMEAYADLELTLAVYRRLLDDPALDRLATGVVVQAYLPDALAAISRLSGWANARADAGLADIKVRLVKGANLAMERADAEIHGWPLATVGSKTAADTNYKRVLDWVCTPERLRGLRLGVAGHNLFDIAFAHLLAGTRGVSERVEFEMLQGMAPAYAQVVSAEVGNLRLYVPVVHPDEFDVAVSYLVRRLEENAAEENFMSAIFNLAVNNSAFDREEQRFRESLTALAADPQPLTPNRGGQIAVDSFAEPFSNQPDTDMSVPANQRRIAALRVVDGDALPVAGPLTDVDAVLATARRAAPEWANRTGAERGAILHAAGAILDQRREQLLLAAAADTGKLFNQTDPEVSEAIDFCRYYARCAPELDAVTGARFVPEEVIVVTPPWNFPVAIPTGSTVAALATGATVVVKPAPQARRCGYAICEALWAAGVPREVLQIVDAVEDEAGKALLLGADRIVLTGGYETAQLFRSWRPEVALNGETSGKNALIITPSADRDRAVWDLVSSAFGHAGQKCSAASLGILVGSVARSQRFRRQLVDAASSLVVDWPTNLSADVGPVIAEPTGKLRRALTQLDGDEVWWLKPEPLDDTGRLWRPGIRAGVAPGSFFHQTECFGPVLGLMHAVDLDAAIDLQNDVDYGLTAGLHSLNVDEIRHWLDRAEAGNLYVNRGITGAIVARQPFGGWKRSAVGPGAKAGGPNYLAQLGRWEPAAFDTAAPPKKTQATLLPLAERILARADISEVHWLRRCAVEDQLAWESEFGVDHDPSALVCEANVFRYRPRQVVVRVQEDATSSAMVRLALAVARCGSPMVLSAAAAVPEALASVAVEVSHSSDVEFANQLLTNTVPGADLARGARVRVITTKAGQGDGLQQVRATRPDIALITDPVVGAARVELMYLLAEQAVSISRHRYGNVDPQLATLP